MAYNNSYNQYRARYYGRQASPPCAQVTDQPLCCNPPEPSVEKETIGSYPVAMCYVPWQEWGEVYDLDAGFTTGTIFPCLNKPFLCSGKGCPGAENYCKGRGRRW